jgi:hypothetical protein
MSKLSIGLTLTLTEDEQRALAFVQHTGTPLPTRDDVESYLRGVLKTRLGQIVTEARHKGALG